MSEQEQHVSGERLLLVWDRGEGRFGGRLLQGAAVHGHYEECKSVDGVKALVQAFGKHFDRVEIVDPMPWQDIASSASTVTARGVERNAGGVSENFESSLIECILRLNTAQRKRLLSQIATRPLDERVQFIEHCNDLAAGVSRTMLSTRGAN